MGRRRWPIILVGAIVAFGLATLALLRVSPDGGVALRSPGVKGATATVFVTQEGLPWGRSALTEYVKAVGAGTNDATVPRFADETRVQYLAELYANLAGTDPVRVPLERQGLVGPDSYTADVMQSSSGDPLPLIAISSRSADAGRAVRLANRVAANLRSYIVNRQNAEHIPKGQRIQLVVLSRARFAQAVEGPKVIAPVMLFGLVMFLTIVAAAVVDNLRRSKMIRHEADAEVLPEVLDFDARKSAPRSHEGSPGTQHDGS